MSTSRSVHTAETSSPAAARALLDGLDGSDAPRVIVFFAGIDHDGAALGHALERRFPGACVLGCSGNGVFAENGHGKTGAAALAISGEQVGACAVALADVGGDIEAGVRRAAEHISARLGRSIRELDPTRWAGVALLEGASGREEQINAAFGDVAPFLPVVGGSAGDNISFRGTWTWADGQLLRDGTALLVAEMLTPFRALKTCHFAPTGRSVVVTRADPARRLLLELDGEPAARFYARAVGVEQAELGFMHFLAHPLGLMIDGQAWLRSGVRVEGDALFFACAVVEGARLEFMRATDMIADTRAAIDQAAVELGVQPGGGVLFNCAYRMLEADIEGVADDYHAMLSRFVHAGMHSNGESYLGHINQTLTGLVFA